MMEVSMESYPLLFTRGDVVVGNGFIASVRVCGRVLLVNEGDAWAVYGVNPGGLAEEAEDRVLALTRFSRAYVEVLQDIAHDAATFEVFEGEIQQLLDEASGVDDWTALVEAVRERDLEVDWVSTGSADRPVCIEVSKLSTDRAAPDQNPSVGDDLQRAA
jgi:hypothetical protein